MQIGVNTKVDFPFKAPVISFNPSLTDVALYDLNSLEFEEIMNESWHPSLTVS